MAFFHRSIFDRPLTFAGALRQAAERLEKQRNGEEAPDVTRLLLSLLLDRDLKSVDKAAKSLVTQRGETTWVQLAQSHHSFSGLKTKRFFHEVYGTGLQHNDFKHLALLNHPRIRGRLKRMEAPAYLRKWAEGIARGRTSPYT